MSYENILFRSDSSATIGLGHVKRNLVYATRLSTPNISFACFELVEDITYPTYHLKSTEVQELIALCNKEKITHLIIDNYNISYEEEKQIKQNCNLKLSVFDDTYEKHYCDEIINHNICADSQNYIVEPFTSISIIEPLIRKEFKTIIKRNRKEKTGIILIAMGGVDSSNLTPAIIKVCKQYKKLTIHVITSSINKNLAELKNIKEITLHIDTHKVAQLMNNSDLAILTPSVIVHEALFMDLPFVAIKTASNQSAIYDYLEKKNFTTLEKFDDRCLDIALTKVLK